MNLDDYEDELEDIQQELEEKLNIDLSSEVWHGDRFFNSFFIRNFFANYNILVYDKDTTFDMFLHCLKEVVEEMKGIKSDWKNIKKIDYESWVEELGEDYQNSIKYAMGIEWGNKKSLYDLVNYEVFDSIIESCDKNEESLKTQLKEFCDEMYYKIFPIIF